MKNPNNLTRTIRHASLLLKAGFRINKAWYRTPPSPDRNSSCDKLVYWKDSHGIQLMFFDYHKVSLKKLVQQIVYQVNRMTKQRATVVFSEGLKD